MHFKIDWVSLIVGRKFTVFALFYFVFEGNFQVQAPGGGGGGLYLERGFKGGFFALRVWGLIFGGAYFWNFTVSLAICKGQVISNQNLSDLFIMMS